MDTDSKTVIATRAVAAEQARHRAWNKIRHIIRPITNVVRNAPVAPLKAVTMDINVHAEVLDLYKIATGRDDARLDHIFDVPLYTSAELQDREAVLSLEDGTDKHITLNKLD